MLVFSSFTDALNAYSMRYSFKITVVIGLVVSALGIRTRGFGLDSRVAPLFHWPRSFSLPGLARFNPVLYQAVLFQQPV